MISLDQLVLSSPKTPVHLPLDIQRYVLLKGLEKPVRASSRRSGPGRPLAR